MRFYRVDWKNEFEPTAQTTDWATSMVGAVKLQREESSATITVVEVPTDRDGLLAFLKKNIWRSS